MAALRPELDRALDARGGLLGSLPATTAYRVFHGAVDGRPGLTVDRYGPVLLVQSFREPIIAEEFIEIEDFSSRVPGVEHVVWNHRGRQKVEVPALSPEAAAEHVVAEHGLRFAFQARHRGIDPWLFLDFRAARRAVRERCAGGRVLNLFAYTCGVGVAAAAAGAERSINIDFSGSALEVGRRNAALNGADAAVFRTDQEDVLPTIRQLGGLRVTGRGARRPYRRYEPDAFDLIVLDPPTWARSPFGAIDPVRDYASLFKPCVLATRPGGAVLASNHVSTVERDDWIDGLRRCAAKAGRPLADVEVITPDEDFPSPDGRHPLKLAWCTVGG